MPAKRAAQTWFVSSVLTVRMTARIQVTVPNSPTWLIACGHEIPRSSTDGPPRPRVCPLGGKLRVGRRNCGLRSVQANGLG